MSLALFALVAAIWGVLLLPLARRGHAEPAARAPRRRRLGPVAPTTE